MESPPHSCAVVTHAPDGTNGVRAAAGCRGKRRLEADLIEIVSPERLSNLAHRKITCNVIRKCWWGARSDPLAGSDSPMAAPFQSRFRRNVPARVESSRKMF